MKSRFSTVDILAMVAELQKCVVGMRVVQVYDVDTKTYLFKLSRQEEKAVLLIESGVRLHTTEFAWPKNQSPSGFAMKLRKHLKNKRIERLAQLGADRVVDLQFGTGEAAYHVILELYDRGNVVLTDGDYLILNILRPRALGKDEDVKLVVREKYPVESALAEPPALDARQLSEMLAQAAQGDTLRKLLTPRTLYGPALLEHVFLGHGLSAGAKISTLPAEGLAEKVLECLHDADAIMARAKTESCQGYIVQRIEKRIQPAEDGSTEIATYQEFHPFLWHQHSSGTGAISMIELPSFSAAVDQFFSSVEMQKITLRAHQREKEALKKLENIRTDHEKRIQALQEVQQADVRKAELIEMNLDLVERALCVVRSALANQIGWAEITELLKEAQEQGDPMARSIRKLKLETNHFEMLLRDPYDEGEEALVDIDIDLSAYANARKYYDQKKHAAGKQQKTIESSAKAYKSAEKKTREALKQVALTTNIAKARKAFWFEKFFWFISSEDYLVVGGRDAQQNEAIVKKYLRPGDIYVHADLHGASSIVIKNPSGAPVPPKTLNEAGTMAICYSAAWDAKVVTSAWWVHHHQVSKTAPTGQYLTPGAFMIRGKKNYLPPSYLIMGFGFLYKLDDESIERHRGERKVRVAEDETEASTEPPEEGPELEMSDESDSEKGSVKGDGDADSTKGDAELFPDTVVKLPHELDTAVVEQDDHEAAEEIVYSQPTRGPQVSRKPPAAKPKPQPPPQEVPPSTNAEKANKPKRGTHGKLKKIKEKYKDQDEDERRLRMEILASAGVPKETKSRKQKKGKKDAGQAVTSKGKQPQPKAVALAKPEQPAGTVDTNDADRPAAEDAVELGSKEGVVKEKASQKEGSNKAAGPVEDEDLQADAEEDEDEGNVGDEQQRLLASLTGCPVAEDGLLFAVPVCAPYAAVQNYKHKVKVTPGTGRRGKAAKTALSVFLLDKNTSPRERDLLRVTKDQDISRNIPGKVKLSAPHLQKRK
uniref:Protein, containing FbpA domain n=1 Tax=Rhipicephalus zambeziensis TaxID=60191 RepID=A0A224YPS8_9ACAR